MSKSSDSTLSVWAKRLITKEDPLFMHKALGFAVLCSYASRLSRFGDSDMGFSRDTDQMATLLTLFIHLSLNVSAFEFHIPAKRITSDGGRIWPQYRWHSLVFASRSLACIAINTLLSAGDDERNLLHANYLCVIGTMLAGDTASKYFVQHQSNSIRDLKAPAAIKYYFSVMQFLATAVALVGLRRSSLHFYMVMVIQVTAFLMTLRRKNLVSHERNIALYAILLGGGFMVALYETIIRNPSSELIWCLGVLGPGAAVLRMMLRFDKYLVWTIMHAINYFVFYPIQIGESSAMMSVWQLRIAGVAVFSTMLVCGLVKSKR